jgi:hypothetical protein
MKALKFLNLTILSALVATSAALYAQDEKQQEEKPRQEEPKRQAEPKRPEEPKRQEEARPAGRQDEMKPPRQEDAKPSRDERQDNKPEQKQENRDSREMRPGQQENAQREGHAAPARKSAHIPDEKFRAQFGREHHFRVERPVMVEGAPGFFYSGYSFVLVDPWPAEWAYSDDSYVEYVDGEYFLFDVLHPGRRIALMVVE